MVRSATTGSAELWTLDAATSEPSHSSFMVMKKMPDRHQMAVADD
jgi:hypothetical protein